MQIVTKMVQCKTRYSVAYDDRLCVIRLLSLACVYNLVSPLLESVCYLIGETLDGGAGVNRKPELLRDQARVLQVGGAIRPFAYSLMLCRWGSLTQGPSDVLHSGAGVRSITPWLISWGGSEGSAVPGPAIPPSVPGHRQKPASCRGSEYSTRQGGHPCAAYPLQWP